MRVCCCSSSICVLLVLLSCAGPTYASSVGWNFAVIIDAGSTGSRVHVFRYYTASTTSPLPTVELPAAVHKTAPGLSAYAFDPKTAARSLLPLLKFAREKVPADQVASTPVQLMATAGLRMLSNGSADAIMTEVRSLLSGSGFESAGADGARVLTGKEEGLWGWLAVNYATGALQAATQAPEIPTSSQVLLGRKGNPGSSSSSSSSSHKRAAPLQGVVELGGASLQVTFAVQQQLPSGQAAELALPRLGPGRLYSRSFDGLGLQAAMEQWSVRVAAAGSSRRRDPCLPSGYAAASGAAFVGLDNLFYTAQVLGLPTDKRISVNSLEAAAKKQCSLSWHAVQAQLAKQAGSSSSSSSSSNSQDEPYLLKACFSSALIAGVLKDGLGIDGNAPLLHASNSVPTPKGSSVEVNWALGALLSEVLQQGGHALGRSHDHIILAAPGAEQGISDAVAAASAASFCLFMLLLSACLNYCRVGVAAGAAAAAAAGLGVGGSNARSGAGAGGRVTPGSSGGITGVVTGLLASAVSAAADAGSGIAAQGGSRGKYSRLRSVSPVTYAHAADHPQVPVSPGPHGSRPASRPPSLGHSGGGVIEVAAYAAGPLLNDRNSSQGGRATGGVLVARR
ncbi:nucleoside phosphatase family-domain-containing protein [Scenedesmus sp. NREL 46B-D3]|nr:nucleoside phosphatase family-domain-containing protein [Scenedesmus sp. NREL 46B-D3]